MSKRYTENYLCTKYFDFHNMPSTLYNAICQNVDGRKNIRTLH